jgi:hypothetical protein
MLLAKVGRSGTPRSGLYLYEEHTTHPEQVPLLALRQIDDNGVLGAAVIPSGAHLVEEEAAQDSHPGEAVVHITGEGPIAEGSGADDPPAVGPVGRGLGTGMGLPVETRSKLSPADTAFG